MEKAVPFNSGTETLIVLKIATMCRTKICVDMRRVGGDSPQAKPARRWMGETIVEVLTFNSWRCCS